MMSHFKIVSIPPHSSLLCSTIFHFLKSKDDRVKVGTYKKLLPNYLKEKHVIFQIQCDDYNLIN